MAEQEIAPYRGFGSDAGYDPRSPRMVIDTLCEKVSGNFKAGQFSARPDVRCGKPFKASIDGARQQRACALLL